MALPVFFTRKSDKDLETLEKYLARRFSPENAQRYIQRVVAACYKIGLAPYQGTSLEHIRPGARFTGFERRITIHFEFRTDRVVILYILYGGRVRRG